MTNPVLSSLLVLLITQLTFRTAYARIEGFRLTSLTGKSCLSLEVSNLKVRREAKPLFHSQRVKRIAIKVNVVIVADVSRAAFSSSK